MTHHTPAFLTVSTTLDNIRRHSILLITRFSISGFYSFPQTLADPSPLQSSSALPCTLLRSHTLLQIVLPFLPHLLLNSIVLNAPINISSSILPSPPLLYFCTPFFLPRMLQNNLPWPSWTVALAPDYTLFMPVTIRSASAYQNNVPPLANPPPAVPNALGTYAINRMYGFMLCGVLSGHRYRATR